MQNYLEYVYFGNEKKEYPNTLTEESTTIFSTKIEKSERICLVLLLANPVVWLLSVLEEFSPNPGERERERETEIEAER